MNNYKTSTESNMNQTKHPKSVKDNSGANQDMYHSKERL